MNSSKRIGGAGQSQPRWLAVGSLLTVGGVLVGLNALFILLVAFGNITDFATNQAFVHHVLSMDTANFGSPEGQGLDPAVMWHAVGSRPLQNAAYIGIIAWELLAGVALGAATISWFARSVRSRTRARALATIGLTMIVVLFVGGFLAIGGEWFQMWRSSDWNGSEAAFRNSVVALFALSSSTSPPRRTTAPLLSRLMSATDDTAPRKFAPRLAVVAATGSTRVVLSG